MTEYNCILFDKNGKIVEQVISKIFLPEIKISKDIFRDTYVEFIPNEAEPAHTTYKLFLRIGESFIYKEAI